MSSNLNHATPGLTPRHTVAANDAPNDAAHLEADYLEPSFLRRLSWVDWAFAVMLVIGAGFALMQYGHWMNVYDKAVLIAAVPTFALLGWHWKPVRPLMVGITVLSLFAIQLYQGNLARAEQAFFLKYFLSSQSAILWMSAPTAKAACRGSAKPAGPEKAGVPVSQRQGGSSCAGRTL